VRDSVLSERGVLGPWQKLALDYKVQGKQAHDAHLVAAMQRHGLTHLLTFNAEHFQRLSSLELLKPETIATTLSGCEPPLSDG
jgi:predicted nucleic acid-binding protein